MTTFPPARSLGAPSLQPYRGMLAEQLVLESNVAEGRSEAFDGGNAPQEEDNQWSC